MLPIDTYHELKTYIAVLIGELKTQVDKLDGAITEQSRVLRDMELKTAIAINGLQKDMDTLFNKNRELEQRVEENRKGLDQEEGTRQIISSENRSLISNLKNEQLAKWAAQLQFNESLQSLLKSLRVYVWTVIFLLALIAVALLFL